MLLSDTPIWASSSPPASHEVALFRNNFSLDTPLESAELQIFADTRYEAWLDGRWIGRGPARFSGTYREYDTLILGNLPPGQHLLAVLVQWAPSTRRSESIYPYLKAHIQGFNGGELKIISNTSPLWKSLLSNAWRKDADLVHSWGLIGPTELLDLNRLDPGWNKPGYSEPGWTPAVVVEMSESSISYRPRSIPIMERYPVATTISDAGLLSPGFVTGEITPQVSEPYLVTFEAASSITFTLETLQESVPPTVTIRLDETDLTWRKASNERPDVYLADSKVITGSHQLSFSRIPQQGLTVNLSTPDITYTDVPFDQGVNAGRRLLLTEPVSDPGQIITSTTSLGLDIEITNLPAYLVLDVGRTVTGRLTANVLASPGTILDIGWDERLSTSYHRPLPYPGSLHAEWNQVDSYILDGTMRSITTIDERAGRFILLAVWGKGPVIIKDLQVYEERYPLELSGEFHSSDPLLDQIWQLGAVTLLPNMTDGYAHPWRERGQWWGDAYIADHNNRVVSNDTSLLKRGLLLMAQQMEVNRSPAMAPNNGGHHMLDYTMLWVHSLGEYLQRTEDTEFLHLVYPQLVQFMEHLESFSNPNTGLLDLPKAHWSQTAYIDIFGVTSRFGQSTALNAMYFGTLQQAAAIAALEGDVSAFTVWQDRADLLKQAINTNLYSLTDGQYLTGIYLNNPVEPTPHAQAWPLAYGVVPVGETERVVSALIESLSPDPTKPNLELYGMNWVLEALGQTGHIQEALDIIRTYYGYLIDAGATTCWERLNADQSLSASLSHSWGSAPTWFLTTYVLGTRQTGPDAWQLKPALEAINYAAGQLPLQNSILAVSWRWENAQQAQISISAGANTSGEIILPFLHPSLQIKLDGNSIWQNGTPLVNTVWLLADGIHISLVGGSHEIDIQL